MRIDSGVINGDGQELCELPKRNRRRHRKSMSSVVQNLFKTCKEIFDQGGPGIIPSEMDVERLKSVLDAIGYTRTQPPDSGQSSQTASAFCIDCMRPSDVGLNRDMSYFREINTEGAPPVTYLHLYECDKFSIGIFCLPPSAVIPLHNHPGMTVFSKILFGSMHIKSYDWADDISCNSNETVNSSHSRPAGVRLAELKIDTVFNAPCNTSILYPAAGGNMHRFTAVTSCAVLDVLGPPYSDPEGRHCTYYKEFPYTGVSGDEDMLPGDGEGYAWLEEKDKPDDFIVVGAQYKGPKIVPK